jgi:hypothetical protein
MHGFGVLKDVKRTHLRSDGKRAELLNIKRTDNKSTLQLENWYRNWHCCFEE